MIVCGVVVRSGDCLVLVTSPKSLIYEETCRVQSRVKLWGVRLSQ